MKKQIDNSIILFYYYVNTFLKKLAIIIKLKNIILPLSYIDKTALL